MNSVIMTREFSVDGLQYRAEMSTSGNFGFELRGGNTSRGSANDRKRALTDLWYHDTPDYDDHGGLLENPLKVFRIAGEILLEWVWAKLPARFGFSASTTRKIDVYRYLVKRLMKKLNGRYNAVEYPPGDWNFYRLVDAC